MIYTDMVTVEVYVHADDGYLYRFAVKEDPSTGT